MTYKPFQEPFTTDTEVVRRRTWEELRRVGDAIDKLSKKAYAYGETLSLAWAPGVNTPTATTRIPIQSVLSVKNMLVQSPQIITQLSGVYSVDMRLEFTRSTGSGTWYIAMFVNNVQIGPGNPITVSGTFFRTSIGAGHAGPDTSVDLRMWPASANATGTINVFESAVVAEDLD